MNNLGPIEGTVRFSGGRRALVLELFYPKSVALLEREKERLEGFDRIEIRQRAETVHPFWDGEKPGLLDIKG